MTAYRFADFVLDVARRELRRGDAPVRVSGRAFDCLAYLIAHRERDVGRDELVAAVFGRPNVSDAQLGQIVLRARRAVDDDGHSQHRIRTVPRFGFRWLAPVEPIADAVPAVDAAAAGAPPPALARDGRRRFPPRTMLLAAALAALSLAALSLFGLLGRGDPATEAAPPALAPAPESGRRVVVLPTRIDGPAEARWARLGLMELLADRLRRAGLAVPPSETTLRLVQAAADAAQLRRASRAELLVDSVATHSGHDWQVALAAVDADGITLRGHGRDADLMRAARRAGDRLLASLGRTAPADAADDVPSLEERLLRAQAAMLANELDTARTILHAAPELQQQAPQLRYWLAQIDFRAGHYDRAITELNRLLEADDAQPLFRARLLNSRGINLIRLDRFLEARHNYTEAIALLDPQRHVAELGRALNGRGITHQALGDFELSLTDLGRARIHLMRSGDAVGVAHVDANLGILEFRRDRMHQALGYFVRAARDFESLGAINELASMRSMTVATHLHLLQTELAAQVIKRTYVMRPRLDDATMRTMLDLDRIQVLLRQGRLAEAGRLLATPAPDALVTAYQRDQYALARVELALQAGRPAAAVQLADEALDSWSPRAEPLRAWMQLQRERAAQTVDLPGQLATQLSDGESSLPTRLVQALTLQRGGDETEVVAAYRQALAQADRDGTPLDLVEAASDYVPWLIERGRLSEAAELTGRVAPWASQDFRAALLQLQLHHAMGQHGAWQDALRQARQLAGDRRLPAALLVPPDTPVTPQLTDSDVLYRDAMQ